MLARVRDRIDQISNLSLAIALTIATAIEAALLATIWYFYRSLPLHITVPLYIAATAMGLLVAVASAIALHRYIEPQSATERKDFVQLLSLFVGGVVGIIGVYFAWVELQESRETTRTTQQNTQRTLENAQEVERNRASETALQSYLEHMQTLIADHSLADTSKVEEDVRAVAQAQTRSLFNGIRPEHKHRPLLFVYAANLITPRPDRPEPDKSILSLRDADLSEVQLNRVSLEEAILSRTNLSSAGLQGANLSGAYLDSAVLIKADLRGARLSGATLKGAELAAAQLDGADLRSADLSGTILLPWQIQYTIGDEDTKLPPYVDRPPSWEEDLEEQQERLMEYS